MRDYPIIDTHAHTFPTREVGRQAIQALPHPGASGIVEDLLPDLDAAGFAPAVMLNFTPTGEMREDSLVRGAKGTAPARWGALEEQVRQSIVGRVQRRNAWTLQVAQEHARLVPFMVITGTWTPPPLSDDEIVSLLRMVGLDRVMFASDWPLCVPLKERERAESLPLSDTERRLLFYENAQRILRI